MKKEALYTNKALAAPDRYSQVIKYGPIAIISGQVSCDVDTGEPLGGSIGDQTQVVLNTIGTILTEMGRTLNDVLMMQIYLSDIGKSAEMNQVYEAFFKDVAIKPARCTVQAGMGDYDVEIVTIVGLEG